MTPSDRYLAAVRFLGMLWTQGTSGMDPADFVRTFEYYLDAFAELEVMGTDETELWRHRMRVALSDDGRPLFEWAAPVRERLERAVRELPVRVEAMDDEAQRLFAVLGAVQPLRALPEDKTHAWALRQSTRIAPPSGSRPPVDERRQRMTLAWANAVPGKLLRVVPGPPERRAGLRVASVQLYEG